MRRASLLATRARCNTCAHSSARNLTSAAERAIARKVGATALTTALTQASRGESPSGLGCFNPRATGYGDSGRSRGVSKPRDRPNPSNQQGDRRAWAAPYPTGAAPLCGSGRWRGGSRSPATALPKPTEATTNLGCFNPTAPRFAAMQFFCPFVREPAEQIRDLLSGERPLRSH